MKCVNLQFDLGLVCKYRSELMGVSVLGVLIAHLISIGNVPHTMFIKAVLIIPSIAFTETFLLLSGLGIFHSLSQSDKVLPFYKRRAKRLVLPYFLMAVAPVFLYTFLNKESYRMFFYRLSTIDFWFGDGCLGMWYVAVSIFLYFIAPWFYKYRAFDSTGRFLIVNGVCLGGVFFCYYFNINYYESTGKWLAQTPAFLIGGFIMNQINRGRRLGWKDILLILLITIIILICALKFPFITPFSRILVRLFGLLLLCVLIDLMCNCGWLLSVLRWLGNYSLELYILHLLIYQPFKCLVNDSLYLISASICLSLLLCNPVHKAVHRCLG